MTELYPVILAGGGGTRLWPLSREMYPKQFLNLLGQGTLLQQTLQRLDGLQGADSPVSAASFKVLEPIVICNEEHRFLVAEQASRTGKSPGCLMLEPLGRNTAPALTCAALRGAQSGSDPLLLMMPADHLILDVAQFHQAVQQGVRLAAQDYVVTFGIIPDRPETGYGYLKFGEAISLDVPAGGPGLRVSAHWVEAFVEKPNLSLARTYVDAGTYVWNSGIFMLKSSIWLKAIGAYRPDILKACEQSCASAKQDGAFFRLDKTAFEACPSESVDYAVMEKIPQGADFRAAVVSMNAGWSDIGSWSSLWQVSDRDGSGNLVKGDVCAIDARNNLLMAEHRFVAALGCEDLLVIETPDAVMVAPRERAQEVKKVVEWLQQQQRGERSTHRRVFRPWGSYESIDSGERFQVKRIVVNPGDKLSLQMHHHRAEHWIVVKGTARVTCGDQEFLLSENQSTYIPLGVQHRLENPGNIPLEIIEVQSGSYLGEDDIVRFQDVYNRA